MRSSHLFLAVASATVLSANPLLLGLFDRSTCNADNCARAVTGTDAQPASTVRKSDCTSFMSNLPTGTVPTYASACSGTVRYSSACSCYGVTATSKSSISSISSSTTSTAVTSGASGNSNSSSASSTRSTTSSGNSTITSATLSTTSKSSTASSTASLKTTSTISNSSSSTASSSTTTTTTVCAKPSCLSDSQATAAVNSFIYLLANPTAADFISKANALLCDNFTDMSDSINSLAGIPLGSATFTNKTAFIAGSGSQPPLILQTYDIFHSCRKIAWRWVSVKGAGNDADEVKGIDTFSTDGCGHICQIFAEFNSAAWLYNLGDPECSPTSMISFASTLTSTTASATATATATAATTTTSA